jgi:hypothetical protein
MAATFSDLPPDVVGLVLDACPDDGRLGVLASVCKAFRAHLAARPAARRIRFDLLNPAQARWALSAADWGDEALARKLSYTLVARGHAALLPHAWRASDRRVDINEVVVVSAAFDDLECLRWACGKIVTRCDVVWLRGKQYQVKRNKWSMSFGRDHERKVNVGHCFGSVVFEEFVSTDFIWM